MAATYTIKGVTEEAARVMATLAAERITGKVTIVVDMREGGIGSAGIEVFRKMPTENDRH